MRFRLTTVAYLIAFLAASMATFGGLGGVLATAGVLAFWAAAYCCIKLPNILDLLIAALIIVSLMSLALPVIESIDVRSRVAQCHNNLKQVALAIHSYAKGRRGRLPAAIERDAKGNAIHSWRTKILPLLDHHAIYDRYRRDEPWNGPNNAPLFAARLEVFICPSDETATLPAPQTNYFAVNGQQTAWPDGEGLPLDEITDGANETILLIEAAGRSIAWAEPRDLTFDEAIELLTAPGKSPVSHTHISGAGFLEKGYGDNVEAIQVAFASGTVRALLLPISRQLAVALLTASAGDHVDLSELDRATLPQLDYGKIYAFVIFLVLAMLPGCRFFRGRLRSPHLEHPLERH
jgi:hypothetical protein